jgi:hypothetical protein
MMRPEQRLSAIGVGALFLESRQDPNGRENCSIGNPAPFRHRRLSFLFSKTIVTAKF